MFFFVNVPKPVITLKTHSQILWIRKKCLTLFQMMSLLDRTAENTSDKIKRRILSIYFLADVKLCP